ncbi:glutamate--tRNA ligase [Allorhodopirellula solitaria]|uniref:Glutamate--tRNA ligase n=1 Tax=Allorhodopirellula solitaria TaxID=2527987 RepID=A0A5C5WZ69_9BACT|nr:glutamate--tRNA ligase [Allorhodopirellula solitaria]TWT56264.1 Glutamate--tRNA ligase 1 [Allorhodopirellula solitaria]
MIRTRFAPSPTGYLHIGGVRTALFNWLLARQSGGQFILRIDDTDAGRNVEAALQPILDGFRWLGMDWDEGPEVGGPHQPYFQSERGDRYRAATAALLESGHAYRDFAKPDELQSLREEARQSGGAFVYDRRWMAADEADVKRFEAEGREGVVRLKMPREGQCVIHDLVRGEVVVEWASEQDHVIARADGSPLYHLASVVDDHDLEITHVVRAAEHLPNTPRQIFIAESLGYELPQYAHLPYVAEPGGTAKLSKRKLDKYLKNRDFANLMARGQAIAKRCGLTTDVDTFNPVLVDFYREIGFLPDALLNYLMLLGWSLDGEHEKFTLQEMIDLFTLDRVTKSPASFDPAKLTSFQADAFAALPDQERTERVLPFAVAAGWTEAGDAQSQQLLADVVTAAGDRLKMAGDIIDFDYCFVDDYEVNAKAFEKRINKPAAARELLGKVRDRLASCDDFSAAGVEATVKGFCEDESIGLGEIIHALRVATTGAAGGFGMFDTLAIVGKERAVARIDRTLG